MIGRLYTDDHHFRPRLTPHTPETIERRHATSALQGRERPRQNPPTNALVESEGIGTTIQKHELLKTIKDFLTSKSVLGKKFISGKYNK